MFFLTGGIAVIICAVIEFCFFCKQKKALGCIGILIKHLVIDYSVALSLLLKVFKYQHFLDTSNYGATNFFKFGLLTFVVGAIVVVITAFCKSIVAFEHEPFNRNKKGKISKGFMALGIIGSLLVFLACVCWFGTEWSLASFGKVTAEQLVINMTAPGGAEDSVYTSIIEGPFVYTLAITSAFAFVYYLPFKLIYNGKKKKITFFNGLARRIICLVLACGMLYGGISHGVKEFDLKQLYYAYYKTSTIFEDEYVNAKTAELTFPEKPRNLIHIYAESLENSFLSKAFGGNVDVNLMPELTELSYEGYIFSDTENKFGGPQEPMGTQWSIASMVNQTTGLPMKMPNAPNDYGSEGNFLPGAWSLMDILTEQGYEQTVMFGADGNFGGLKYYFMSHGNTTVFDLGYARRNGLVPEDYKVWWGYEDDKLYEFAKDELTRMYETGKPFNFMMETADTHRPGGYIGENTPTPYESSYANAVAYSTAQIVEFVRWIEEQPFYENTTIVIIGDHLSMETDFFEDYGFTDDYDRTQFNLILNPAPNVDVSDEKVFHNRLWSNMDMFPTILAAMGVEIKGERLGIGTNLFSGKDTLIEKYGFDTLNTNLQMKSELYANEILMDPTAYDNADPYVLETTTLKTSN